MKPIPRFRSVQLGGGAWGIITRNGARYHAGSDFPWRSRDPDVVHRTLRRLNDLPEDVDPDADWETVQD